MTNTILIAVGVAVPLVLLVGGAGAFIWWTERKRKEAIAVREIPYRPRIPSFLYRGKEHYVEDGIEVCSPRPSLSKNGPPALNFDFQHELPSLHIENGRSDSAVQSPTDTLSQILELEGTPGKELSGPPSKAKLRHSSDEQRARVIVRKEVPKRASLQPQERYYARQALQPISTGNNSLERVMSSRPDKDMLNAEIRDETSSPTVSAISEVSGRGMTSPLTSRHTSDVPGEYRVNEEW